MAMLSSGHLAVDFAAGGVPALLPFLTERFDLTYTAVAAIMLAATVSSSLVQPAFGLWSDRRGALWLLPGGIALAGVALALTALAPSYWLVLPLVFASGLGIAAFHPEGAKFAAYASGRRRASGMALFNIGGNTGYALGPVLITPLVVWLGIAGGALAAVPVLAAAAVLLVALPAIGTLAPEREAHMAAAGDDRRGAMGLLVVVIVMRSVAWFGLLTFVPLWVVELGGTEAEGNRELSLMLLAGAAGTLVLGPVADRIGLRRTLVLTQAALPPLILAFVIAGSALGTLALMLVGMCVVGTFGVTMVLGQLYLPRHVGMASGLVVGLAIGVGGVAAIALGAVADTVDLETALWVSALAPAVGVLAALALPPAARAARVAAEAAAP
jgi:FSR family fosmidomycin resistance protein-like MFS transporter